MPFKTHIGDCVQIVTPNMVSFPSTPDGDAARALLLQRCHLRGIEVTESDGDICFDEYFEAPLEARDDWHGSLNSIENAVCLVDWVFGGDRHSGLADIARRYGWYYGWFAIGVGCLYDAEAILFDFNDGLTSIIDKLEPGHPMASKFRSGHHCEVRRITN